MASGVCLRSGKLKIWGGKETERGVRTCSKENVIFSCSVGMARLQRERDAANRVQSVIKIYGQQSSSGTEKQSDHSR